MGKGFLIRGLQVRTYATFMFTVKITVVTIVSQQSGTNEKKLY